jgi:hypothetical protein
MAGQPHTVENAGVVIVVDDDWGVRGLVGASPEASEVAVHRPIVGAAFS